MDPSLLLRVLNATSIPAEEVGEYVNEYVQTQYTVMLEPIIRYMSEQGMEEELGQLREAFDGLESEDDSLEDILDGKQKYYDKWMEIMQDFLNKYTNAELLGSIDKALKELDNEVINEILDNLSSEDREKVAERLDILFPDLKSNNLQS